MTMNSSARPAMPFIETAESAASFWQIGIIWRLLATGLKTAGALCFLDEVVGDKPGGPATHAHPQDEGLYVIDGQCTFNAGGETMSVGPGSFVAVPRYTQHSFMADAGARLLNFYLPAGFDMLVMGLGVPAERNEPPRDGEAKMPPRALVEKLSRDYGQIPVLGLPFADPPDPTNMKTEPLKYAPALPFSISRDTAPGYWSNGILWSVLAEGSTTDGSYALFEELCPKGTGAPPHLHTYTDEIFYVLEGEAEFLAGDVRQTAKAGALIFIPRGTVHAFKVRSEMARFLNLYTQAGFERMLEATGQRTNEKTPPPAGWRSLEPPRERMAELFAELGMHPVSMPSPFD